MTEFGINKYACCICIRACMTIFKIRLFIIIAVFKKKKRLWNFVVSIPKKKS